MVWTTWPLRFTGSIDGQAVTLGLVVWQDLIPASVWEQLPVVVLFCAVFLWAAKYHFQYLAEKDKLEAGREERWQQLLKEERQAAQASFERALESQRESQMKLLDVMQKAGHETIRVFARDAFEEVIERVSAMQYREQRDQMEKSK